MNRFCGWSVCLLILIAFSWTGIAAEPSIEWSRTFDGSEFTRVVDVIPTSNGGFAIFGTTQVEPGTHQFRLLKLDQAGEIEWDYVGEEVPSVEASSIIVTTDGGYFITGIQQRDAGSASHILNHKLSAIGQSEWTTSFGISGREVLNPLPIELHPGAFIVLATAIADTGNELCRIETKEGHIAVGSVGCRDLGFRVVTGLSRPAIGTRLTLSAREGSAEFGDRSGLLISLPATGVCGSIVPIEGPGSGFAFDVEEASDGDLLVLGSASLAESGSDIYVAKYDTEGSQLWYSTYGGKSVDFGVSIAATEQGGAVVVGTSLDFDGRAGVLVFRLDSEGNMLWSAVIGHRYDAGVSIHRTPDGGYIIGANCGSESGCSGIRVIKLSPDLE
ncbi:hypothetical protein KKG90_08595 [Candidatus Bipolaricaulota bacterium]|nr:hypothetical protein [Candidatus Bipolaricaulota bacterium]